MSFTPAVAGYERSTNLIKVTPDGEVVWKRSLQPRRWGRRRAQTDYQWSHRVNCAVVLAQAITGTDSVAVLLQQRSASGNSATFATPIPSYCLMRVGPCGCVEWERYFSAAAYSNATYGQADHLISRIMTGYVSAGDNDNENEGWGNLLSLSDGTLLLYYRMPDEPTNPVGFIPHHEFATIDHNSGDVLTTWHRSNLTQPNQQPGPWPMLAIPETDEWLQIDPINSYGVVLPGNLGTGTMNANYRERCLMNAVTWERSELAAHSGSPYGSGFNSSGVYPQFLCVSDSGNYLSTDCWFNQAPVLQSEVHVRRGLTLRYGDGRGGIIEGAPDTMWNPGSDPAILAEHCPVEFNNFTYLTNGYDANDRAFDVKSAAAVNNDYIVSAKLHNVNNSGNLTTPILRRYDSSLAVQWEVSAPTCHRLLSTSDGVFALARDPADNNARHFSRIDPADGSVIWRLRSECRHTLTATEDGMLWLGGAENLITYSTI